MNIIKRYGHIVLSIYVMVVFLQSLFFKFKRDPETIYIFENKLDTWAGTLGYPGLFAPGGIFSAYVIGSFELIAATAILIGTLFAGLRILQGLGALLGIAIISGAIFFHLCTPLGVVVQDGKGHGDGGELFMLACGVWISCAILIYIRRGMLLGLIGLNRTAAMAHP